MRNRQDSRDEPGDAPIGGDVVSYALGLEDQPSIGHHYRCPGCDRSVRSLEHDGYCRRCALGEDEYDPAVVARAHAKIMARWGRR